MQPSACTFWNATWRVAGQQPLLKAEAPSPTSATSVHGGVEQHLQPRSVHNNTAQNTPWVGRQPHQEWKSTLHPYQFPTAQQTQGSVNCVGKRAIAETGWAPYSPSRHGAEGTDTQLVSLISASYLCIKNSALQSFSATMLLPGWEELILFQETTAKHDVKQQA